MPHSNKIYFSANVTYVQISAIHIFVGVTQREDFAMHLWDPSPWFRQGFHSVQRTVMEWRSQILIAPQQRELPTAHYQGPAGRSYAPLLKGLRVLPLPTVLTTPPFQLVCQLLLHPAVIYLPHWSIPVTLNFAELDAHADVLGACCCWPCPASRWQIWLVGKADENSLDTTKVLFWLFSFLYVLLLLLSRSWFTKEICAWQTFCSRLLT